MLYRSTRNKLDTFTAHRVLHFDCSPTDGYIIPIRVPALDIAKVEVMKQAERGQNIADILNLFFDTGLTAWDIESAMGKDSLKNVDCRQKVVLAQCWKNPGGNMDYYIQSLFDRLWPDCRTKPTKWVRVAIRISIIAATILDVLNEKGGNCDIAVNSADFEQALAVYYCRLMGLPIRKILIACNENCNIWDFVYRGTINFGASVHNTAYPSLDKVIPDMFEAYLCIAYGFEETRKLVHLQQNGGHYVLPEQTQLPSADNIFVSVIGQERVGTVINSFLSNNGIHINPYAAFSLGAMQDYRAKAGESNLTIVFEEDTP